MSSAVVLLTISIVVINSSFRYFPRNGCVAFIDLRFSDREFSQFQRGAGGNSLYMGDQTFPKRATYPTSTKKMLAIMLPMAGVVVLGGIVALVFIFYKKFRHEQYRIRKLPGTMRLQENYSSKCCD